MDNRLEYFRLAAGLAVLLGLLWLAISAPAHGYRLQVGEVIYEPAAQPAKTDIGGKSADR